MLPIGPTRVKRFSIVPVVLTGLLVLAAIGLARRRSALPARSRPSPLARETRLIMGTNVTVQIVLQNPDHADTAIAVGFAPIRAVDARMSTYKPDSELMQVNRTAHLAPVRISAHLQRVLEISEAVTEKSGGAFDVTCGPLIDLWRDAGKRKRVPTDAQRTEVLQRVGHRKLHLDIEAGTVRFDVPDMKVVLGAVAKGYAVDLAIEALRKAGYENALVEAGGDLRAIGSAPRGRPWRVGVQDPRLPDPPIYLAIIEVRDRAVVTSGNYRRFTEIGGKRYSHIVDPRTGLPVAALPSVTVIAADAAHADALATAVSVLGLERGMALIESISDAECLLVTIDGDALKLHRSSGFAEYESSVGEQGEDDGND